MKAAANGRLNATGSYRVFRKATGTWEGPFAMTPGVQNAPRWRRIWAALARAAGRIERWLA